MAHSRYLRRMARSLRVERRLTVDELAARLTLPRSTIYYWVRDLPLREEPRGGELHGGKGEGELRGHGERGGATARLDARSEGPRVPGGDPYERGDPYEQGLDSFEELAAQPTFRDFVCIYAVAGEQGDRRRVALTNADPAVMRLTSRWLRRLSDRALSFSLQCSRGQSLAELRRFWGEIVGAEPRAIRSLGERPEAPRPRRGDEPSQGCSRSRWRTRGCARGCRAGCRGRAKAGSKSATRETFRRFACADGLPVRRLSRDHVSAMGTQHNDEEIR